MEENNNFNNVYKESSDNESELENKKEKKLILSEFEENKIKIERIKKNKVIMWIFMRILFLL